MDTGKNHSADKQSFIFDCLLPFYFKQMESGNYSDVDKEKITEMIARLKIFPYVTGQGHSFGILKEKDTKWYVCEGESQSKVLSTESYRILDHRLYKKDQLKTTLRFLGMDGKGYLGKFSDEVVLDDLVQKMGSEDNYTERWWMLAADAFVIWKEKNKGSDGSSSSQRGSLAAAASNKDGFYFLFDDEYCKKEYQELLGRTSIYFDIRKTDGYRNFMIKHPDMDRTKKIVFLKLLGIPASFIKETGWFEKTVTKQILDLFQKVSQLSFPIHSQNQFRFDMCRLAEYIFRDILFRDDPNLAKKTFQSINQSQPVRAGIPILNINGGYMPGNVSMFFIDKVMGEDKADITPNVLNKYIVEPGRYDPAILEMVATDVTQIGNFKSYQFEKNDIQELDFYRWAWQWTKDTDIKKNILLCFTRMGSIQRKYKTLVLDVLSRICGIETTRNNLNNENAKAPESMGFTVRFDIELSEEEVFRYRIILNSLYRSKDYDISVYVDGRLKKENPGNRHRVLDAVQQVAPYLEKKIEADDIWERVYLLDASHLMDFEYGNYVLLHYKDPVQGWQSKQDILLLVKHKDANSYMSAIVAYIRDQYGLVLEGLTIDWAKQYRELSAQVDKYLNAERLSFHTDDDIQFKISDMADVPSLEDEISIWKRLETERKSILKNRVSDVDLESWRVFLNSKYHGRCQLCGKRTVTGPDNSFYWTFRIVKEKSNALANLSANLFCLCPSCHGELSYGFKGKDLTHIKKKTNDYRKQLEMAIDEELDDMESIPSTISGYADAANEFDGFRLPVICDVVVNGNEHKMKFSWEHFIRLAFLISDVD